MLVHRRVILSIKCTVTHLYAWVERGSESKINILLENTAQCPRSGLETGMLDLETIASALTMRPPRLHMHEIQ